MTTKNDNRVLVATDEGTHGMPRTTRIYRLADGRYQTVVKHGNGLISDDVTDHCPTDAEIRTDGRMRRGLNQGK